MGCVSSRDKAPKKYSEGPDCFTQIDENYIRENYSIGTELSLGYSENWRVRPFNFCR